MTEWGVKYAGSGIDYIGVTVYNSEEEARRQLSFAQMDIPAVLVKRESGETEWEIVIVNE